MEFNSVSEFLAMGHHGLYVWLSYGLTAVIIALNVAQPLLRRRLLKEQAQRLRREKKHAPQA
jgi:heme exporter protein D